MRNTVKSLVALATLTIPIALGAGKVWAQSPAPAALQADPRGATDLKLPYFPVPIELSATKPDGILKEPVYKAAPKYGVFHLGNGPKSQYVVALDEPADSDWKIYLDANQNGDLTDDGDGAWTKKDVRQTGRTMYGVNNYVLRASYGTPAVETSTAPYGVSFYRFADLKVLLMYRTSTRAGAVNLGDKTYHVVLAENDADALYNKPIDDNGKPLHGAETRPVWLIVLPESGLGSTGPRPALNDVRGPFLLAGKPYEAKIADDGSSVTLTPTTRRVVVPQEPEEKPLLAKGTPAPDFTADTVAGGKLKLSDYRGKVVILDFWATWCGPCQASMPHLERVYQKIKAQNVAVLGVCVADSRQAFKAWMPENKRKYTFTFAFDPAERNPDKSISAKLYNVTGIPTTYIIDKNGKVVDSIVGYDEGDHRLEDALKKIGLKLTA